MNKKVFAISLAILALVMTLYPTYTWGQEREEIRNGLYDEARQQIVANHPDVVDLPLKQRGFSFGAKTMPKLLGTRTVLLQREYTMDNFILDYTAAIFVAIIFSVSGEIRRLLRLIGLIEQAD